MSSYVKTALLLGLMTGLILVVGKLIGGNGGMVVALILAAVLNFASYWFSDKIVLKMYRGREVSPAEAPRFHAIVDRLIARSGLPKPRLYLLPGDSPNAFATGRNPSHAAVAATEGILRFMDDEEMEGVLAHELAHVKHRDILISSVAATIAGAITMLAHMARWGAIFGGYGNRDDRGGNPFALLMTAILAPIAAMIIQMAVSRSREFAADAGGAAMAGQPYGLARALEKLDTIGKRVPMPATPETAHMFIVQPFTGQALMNLFSTHPPIQERIRRLLGR
ncbi:MAG TPA: zinc metalloprotease HtpX [Candidatus Polarisedimenticolaceae bacterium]|nr:zinc metalloprotease HtpX [Candidatus Polarisedimenticolaceae bacterium]